MYEQSPDTSIHNVVSDFRTTPRLKESTGRLLLLLDKIELKTRTRSFKKVLEEDPSSLQLTVSTENEESVISGAKLEDEHESCSIYQRLTRICNCLNRAEFNDLTIEFNSDTRYTTSQFGEILKNIRSLKKFIYIGNNYTQNALEFIIEGLTSSTVSQKGEIVKACAYADICNLYGECSLVKKCVTLEHARKAGKSTIPILAARFLSILSHNDEGKQYLNFSSKLSHEIKEFLNNVGNKIDTSLNDALFGVLVMLKPNTLNKKISLKNVDTRICERTVNMLLQYHQFMSLNESSIHLRTLQTLSDVASLRPVLIKQLSSLINVFKSLLIKYNNSELNITVTNILNNIVTKALIEEVCGTRNENFESTNTKAYCLNRSTSTYNEEVKVKKTKVNFVMPLKCTSASKPIPHDNTPGATRSRRNNGVIVVSKEIRNPFK